MELHDFNTVVTNASEKVREGWEVYQQFVCGGCGAKQTMETKNHFYTSGVCEECGVETDLVKSGINFLGIRSRPESGVEEGEVKGEQT